jgi:hypothetical protein
MNENKSTVAKFYLIATFCLMPLYYDNGYFNTLSAKATIFYIAAGITATLAVALWLFGKNSLRHPIDGIRRFAGSFDWMDGAVFLFGTVALLSCLFSEYKEEAFTGSAGWSMGGLTLASLSFLYFFLSRNLEFEKKDWGYLMLGGFLVMLLGFLNGMSIDPLSMHAKLIESELFEYISTIGNVNSYAGYLSLLIPVVMVLFLHTTSRAGFVTESAFLTLGFANMFMSNSDGTYLGVGISFLFLIYYVLRRQKLYQRFLLAVIYFGIAGGIVRLIECKWTRDVVPFSGISAMILHDNLWVCLLIGGVVLYVLFTLWKNKHTLSERVTRMSGIVYAVVVCVAAAVAIGYTALHFSGSWGTKRGYIWMFAVSIFGDGNLLQKIIGIGPDCFGIPTMERFGDFIAEKWGERVANAHNEYLQYLVTMGLAGLAAYAGIYLSALKEYWKKESWSISRMAALAGILGYMGQAAVNNPQALNMATLFVLLAIFRREKIEGKCEVK